MAGQRNAEGGLTRLVGLVAALLAPAYLLNLYNHWARTDPLSPGWVGVLALVSIWGFYALITGEHEIWNAVCGQDGRASTSKFQAFVWTGAVVFGYVAIVAAHGLPPIDASGSTTGLPAIHPNILAALGISLGTSVGAAVVTANATSTGQVVKVHQDKLGMSPIFTDDAGNPDLGKIQLVTFTFVAVAVFVGQVLQSLSTSGGPASLPDIDPSLAALTGIGSAVYLGGKLATTATPYISSRNPPTVAVSAADPAARTVTVQGANFGTDPVQIQAYVGDQVVASGVTLLAGGNSLQFVVPTTKNDTSAWVAPKTPSTATEVSIVVAGRRSNALPITLTP